MDKRNIIILLLLSITLAYSCKTEENRIKDAAELFLNAYYVDYDYDKAENLVVLESRITISSKKESTGVNYFANKEKAVIVVKNAIIKSEKFAVVEYMANEMNKQLVLIKNDKTNKWEVDTFESGIDGSSLGPNPRSGYTSRQSNVIN
jgi:hypothetical protein